MPESISPRLSERMEADPVTARVHDTRDGLATLIADSAEGRRVRNLTPPAARMATT